MPISRLLTLF